MSTYQWMLVHYIIIFWIMLCIFRMHKFQKILNPTLYLLFQLFIIILSLSLSLPIQRLPTSNTISQFLFPEKGIEESRQPISLLKAFRSELRKRPLYKIPSGQLRSPGEIRATTLRAKIRHILSRHLSSTSSNFLFREKKKKVLEKVGDFSPTALIITSSTNQVSRDGGRGKTEEPAKVSAYISTRRRVHSKGLPNFYPIIPARA